MDLDELEGGFRSVDIRGSYGRYSVAFVEHLVPSQNVVAEELQRQSRRVGLVNRRQVLGGGHGQHARIIQRAAGINGLDSSVGMRASQYLAENEARK